MSDRGRAILLIRFIHLTDISRKETTMDMTSTCESVFGRRTQALNN